MPIFYIAHRLTGELMFWDDKVAYFETHADAERFVNFIRTSASTPMHQTLLENYAIVNGMDDKWREVVGDAALINLTGYDYVYDYETNEIELVEIEREDELA